jgi:hypothetical protein
MTPQERLMNVAKDCPPELVEEATDSLQFLKTRQPNLNFDAMMLRYPTMPKDWFNSEEEEAWKDYQ